MVDALTASEHVVAVLLDKHGPLTARQLCAYMRGNPNNNDDLACTVGKLAAMVVDGKLDVGTSGVYTISNRTTGDK